MWRRGSRHRHPGRRERQRVGSLVRVRVQRVRVLVAAVGLSSSLVLDARLTNVVTLSGLAPFTCYAFAIVPKNKIVSRAVRMTLCG